MGHGEASQEGASFQKAGTRDGRQLMKSKLKKLFKKYKKELEDTVVMDDYDGGRVEALLKVITDIEKILDNEHKN